MGFLSARLLNIFVCLGVASFGVTSAASIVEGVRTSCGLSDYVYDYIAKTTKKKAVNQFGMSALVGSGRRLIVYEDGSWILTLEFLNSGSVSEDRTCIIATGTEATQFMATDIMKKSPWIGPQPGEI